MKTATDLLKNKWVWIALAVLVTAIMLRKNGARWWSKLMATDRGNYEGQTGLNEAEKASIEELAHALRTEINNTDLFGNERELLAAQALGLNDTALRYLAEFYADINEGTPMIEALNGEWFKSDAEEELIGRLDQLNL